MFCALSSLLNLVSQILQKVVLILAPTYRGEPSRTGHLISAVAHCCLHIPCSLYILTLPWDLSMEYNHGAGLMAIHGMYSLPLPSAPTILAFCSPCEITSSMILGATILILSSHHLLGFFTEYYILYFRRINSSQSNLIKGSNIIRSQFIHTLPAPAGTHQQDLAAPFKNSTFSP